MANRSVEILATSDIDPGDIKPYSQMLQEANTKLRELVFRDGLTGLYNYRYFQEMVDKEIDRFDRYNSIFALSMYDIVLFKKVNDNYSHPCGDLVLSNIAQTIQKAVRPSDIVVRYSGEEFAVIMPEANESDLKIFAERLRRRVEQMSTLEDNKELKVTISVGGTCCSPGSGKQDKKTIIDTADRALYASKHGGRNCTAILPATEMHKEYNLTQHSTCHAGPAGPANIPSP